MGKATVRSGVDAWVGATYPNKEHPKTPYLRVESGECESLVYLRSPVPLGATVDSATLRMYVRSAPSATSTASAQAVDDGWKARQVNWNNKPGVTGTAATASVSSAAVSGDPVDFDVTADIQAVADGGSHYGWRLSTDSTSQHRFYALNAGVNKPTLIVEWSQKPAAPTSLAPSEGVVSVAAPTLTFGFGDVSRDTSLSAVQVQIDPAQDEATPDFDSGVVATTVPELDLSATAFPGLSDGEQNYWRVRVKGDDTAGLWSDWSDWATLDRKVKPTLTITNPPDVAEPYVEEPTPPVTWTFGGTQTAWQVIITAASDRSVVLYSSAKRGGTDLAHTLPEGVLTDGRAYSVGVRAWDAETREATPGDPIFVEAWRDFVMTDDAGTSGVTGLDVTTPTGSPWVDIAWSRGTAPDAFAIYRDSTVIAVELPADVLVSGTDYAFRDYGASPHRTHTYDVRAVVNGAQSEAGSTDTVKTNPVGIWLADPETGTTVVLAGDEEGDWSMSDDAATYMPVGGDPIRVVSHLQGYAGSVSGLLVDGLHGVSFAAQEAALWALKANPSRAVRLVVSDVNVPALIGDLSVSPTPLTRDGDIVKGATFSFWQVGELPFEPII